jgi:hypothetical protein
VVLHITGAHSHSLADRTLAFLLQQPENLQPRWIGHGLEREHELLVRERHRPYLHAKIDLGQYEKDPFTPETRTIAKKVARIAKVAEIEYRSRRDNGSDNNRCQLKAFDHPISRSRAITRS